MGWEIQSPEPIFLTIRLIKKGSFDCLVLGIVNDSFSTAWVTLRKLLVRLGFVIDDLEIMWNKVVVAYYKVLYLRLRRGTEENYEKYPSQECETRSLSD
jgi:hypothetical protein